jgi:uncharacterized protein (TIGR03086 family)
MTEIADRYRRIAGEFTTRVEEVPDDAWDNPAPCEGWVARDVVGHLVEWLPAFFFEQWDLEPGDRPTIEDDPVKAWAAVSTVIQAALDDPAQATAVQDTRMGPQSFEQAFDMIGTNDVFMHTWDLSRAAGLDESLDPVEVHNLFTGMEPMDEMLRQSGQYGPRVPVPDDADEQTKLLAFIGRDV